MRIAQISTLATSVRQESGGSVEQLVWLLGRELTAMGHQVTTFAAAGSEVCGELVATMPGSYGIDGAYFDWQLCEWVNLCRAVEQSKRFDIMHSHAYLWGIPLQPICAARLVHTIHVLPSDDQARLWAEYPASSVTAITGAQWSAFPHLRPAAIIPHGVDPDAFTLRSTHSNSADRYLLYLGRFTPDKGIPHAIATARAVGLPLVLAGPENPFFQAEIKPLVDGDRVRYIGSVAGAQRDALLGGAEALLFPIEKPEAFGLVMIEAMMCGTPVVATALGAVGEIVDDGITGCLASSVEQLAIKVELAGKLDRRHIREVAVKRFSARRMACQYAQVYETILRSRSAR